MGPIFNIFFLNKVVVGPMNNAATVHEQSVSKSWKRVKKKKKKKQNANAKRNIPIQTLT